MNEARNAVKRCRKEAFHAVTGQASVFAQCRMLEHLADTCRWSCQVLAVASADCDHKSCAWICYQTEADTSEEMKTDDSTVRRTRNALIAQGWIRAEKTSGGRGATWFYVLNRSKLVLNAQQKRDDDRKTVRRPAFFDDLVAAKFEELEDQKVGNSPIFSASEGRQSAYLSVAPAEQKVGNLPQEDRQSASKGRQFASEDRQSAYLSDRYKEERNKHTEHAEQGPVVVSDRMDPEMLAKQVQVEARLMTWELLPVLTEQCRFAVKDGMNDTEVVASMVQAWTDLQDALAAGHLRHPWGAKTFFGESHWRRPKAWPWKDGYGPKVKHDTRVQRIDPIREQIEREARELAEADADREALRKAKEVANAA